MSVEQARVCDVCRKPLSAHSTGAGIPICPGIYAPGFRSTLHDRIAELERQLATAQAEAFERAASLVSAAPRTGIPSIDAHLDAAFEDASAAIRQLAEEVKR